MLVSNSMPDASLLVLDKASVLSVYGQVLLATSTDFYFGSDNVALRATFRFGVAIADTDAEVFAFAKELADEVIGPLSLNPPTNRWASGCRNEESAL